MDDKIYDIAFSFDQSITPIEKRALFERYSSANNILKLGKNTIKNLLGRRWTGSKFDIDIYLSKAEKISSYMDKMAIKTVRFDDEKYPRQLKEIPDHPFLLYYRGNIDFSYEKSIAMVGTREPDIFGEKRARVFSVELAKKDFTIISGLAKGIDSISHSACLEVSGKTIAVLGCGIDKAYPSENKELYREILDKNGGIISEYPPGTDPYKWNFPRRNRIIVGLSRGVFIAQSPEKSGSIISACLASDYNRDLFIASPEKESGFKDHGNISMIFMGGREVFKPEDIIEEYEY